MFELVLKIKKYIPTVEEIGLHEKKLLTKKMAFKML